MSDEITDEELESLQNPVPRVQEAEWKRILSQINQQNLDKLLGLAGFKLIDWQFHAQSQGVINKIFFIRAQRVNDSKIVELVLRLNNPHPFWLGKRNRTEIGIMNYIKKNSKIPVATIYSYSSDPNTSIIGCDYILMEKLPGEVLENLITNDIYDLPDRLFDDIIAIVQEIKYLKEFDPKIIGAFDENMNLTDLTLDGPTIKKSSSFIDFLNQQFNFSLKEVKKIKKYSALANRLEKFQADLNEFTKNNPQTNELNFSDTMAIQHGDLNASNILVDPETYKITGILDWDFCKHTFDDKSLEFLNWWCDEANEEKMRERMNTFRLKYSNERKQVGEELRHKLNFIAETANQLGFYVTSWFRSDNFDAEARQHMDHFAKMIENLLNEFKFDDYISF